MGMLSFIWSVFKFRRKQTTQEKLQRIDEEIESLNESSRRNQQLQKTAVLYLMIASILIYSASIFVFYLWYFPPRWDHRLLYSLPFLLFPIVILGLKKLLHRIYVNRISINATALKELKKDKKKILENVMDTETYKVAKELLQKYDPQRSLVEQGEQPLKQSQPKTPDGQELRKRNVQSAPVKPTPSQHAGTNGYPATPAGVGPRPPGGVVINGGSMMRTPGGVPMIRGPGQRAPVPIGPILPRERSVFDKVCDYVIGDGPNNRFALICKQCCGHNGMVLAEEFQFTSYRCCYCGFFNQARTKRLSAPKLPVRAKVLNRSTASESANSTDTESTKADDTTDDKEKLMITEEGEGPAKDATSEPPSENENVTEEVNTTADTDSNAEEGKATSTEPEQVEDPSTMADSTNDEGEGTGTEDAEDATASPDDTDEDKER